MSGSGILYELDNAFILKLAEHGDGQFVSNLPKAVTLKGPFGYLGGKAREFVQGLRNNPSIVRLGLQELASEDIELVKKGICEPKHRRKQTSSKLSKANKTIRMLDFRGEIDADDICGVINHLTVAEHKNVVELGLGLGLDFQSAGKVMASVSANPNIHGIAIHGDVQKQALFAMLMNLPPQVNVLELENWSLESSENLLDFVITAFNSNTNLQRVRFSGAIAKAVVTTLCQKGIALDIAEEQLSQLPGELQEIVEQNLSMQSKMELIEEPHSSLEDSLNAANAAEGDVIKGDNPSEEIDQNDLLILVDECWQAVNRIPGQKLSKAANKIYGDLHEKLEETQGNRDKQLGVLADYIDDGKGSYKQDSFNCRLIIRLNAHCHVGLVFEKISDLRDLRNEVANELRDKVVPSLNEIGRVKLI